MGLYWSLFLAFLRVGTFGFGGGPALIPLIEREVVGGGKWMSAEEFIDVLAMGNALPGPIATKMAIFIGLRAGGPFGAVAALGGLLLPSSVAVIIFAALYYRYRHVPAVQGIVRGVRPVVIALLMVVVAHLAPKSVFTWHTFLIALGAFIIVFYFKVHPVFTIVIAAVIGYWFYR